MTDVSLHSLNQTELLHLALDAGRRNEFAQALACLKEAASRDDVSAEVLHLLGAQYAALQFYEQARAAMHGALERNPELAAARVQLALLELGNADVAAAKSVLAPLFERGPDDPFHHFARGLTALASDQLGLVGPSLNAGIALNQVNAPLNLDMRRIIDAVADATVDTQEGEATQHLVLAAYAGALVPSPRS